MAKAPAQTNGKTIGVKITEKGGLSVYGLQRFPVTLYADQWRDLLAQGPAILKFMDDNASKLKSKPEGGMGAGVTALGS